MAIDDEDLCSDCVEYNSDYDYYYDDVNGDVSDDGENWQLEEEEADDELEEDSTKIDHRYQHLTEDELHARQDADTAKVSELFAIPPGFATILLRYYNWSLVDLQDKLFSDDRVGAATGVALDGVPMLVSDRPLVCAICFDQYPAGEMRSAGCSHFYCHDCWREYVHVAVCDGPRCLSLRCPDPKCSVAVARELIDVVANDEDRARYATFSLRSYVEESNKIKWCPGPGCTVAMEFVGSGGDKQNDVKCRHGHEFCWQCGEEAHRPVSCETVRAWLEKNALESETASWVLANTKHCPKCRRPIEKNRGCMHMTCHPPCLHEFCWLCLGSWTEHRFGDMTSCNRYNEAGNLTDDMARREQGMASLDRYLHFYERWVAHGKARQKAVDDIVELESSGGCLDQLSEATGVPVTDLCFLTEAYKQIAECRLILRWTYAYGYYHLGETASDEDRNVMECAQGEAERQLEKLHDCAEESKDLLDSLLFDPLVAVSLSLPTGDDDDSARDKQNAAVKINAYRQRLVGFTGVCRAFFRSLVGQLF
ncbi:hypothetical protein ABZP36_035637 [Zizania latifolia]